MASTVEKSESIETSTVLRPKERFKTKIKEVMERENAIGYYLVRGIKTDSDDEEESKEADDEDGDDDEKEYTEEQYDSVRAILINENRDKQIEKYKKLILGNQYEDNILMFTTSFSYLIFSQVPKSIKTISKKSKPERFDCLFSLTFVIGEYDSWMHDFEDDEEFTRLTKSLGRAWKTLLSFSNNELGIDEEYTRQGIIEFLDQFTEKIECNPLNITFSYK